MENLREIDEYPWHAGSHALTHNPPTYFFSSLWGFPLLSPPSTRLSSALLLFSTPLTASVPSHPGVVTNPVPHGKNIPHSTGKEGT